MQYTFNLVGVSPMLCFFYQQQELNEKPTEGVEYLGNHKCTLDTFIGSVETVSPKRGWNVDQVVDTVIKFWMTNTDSIHYWKARLEDAGSENVLVARVADISSLRNTFESLLGE